MVDMWGSKYAGKWYRLDTFMIIMVAVIILSLLLFLFIVIIFDNKILWIMFIVMLIIYTPFIFIIWGLYKLRKRMWIKVFNYEDIVVVRVIDKLLRDKKTSFRRLSLEGTMPKFPLKYAEVFQFVNANLKIRVQRQVVTGTIVEIGPIGIIDTEMQIEVLKRELDNAFLPKGM